MAKTVKTTKPATVKKPKAKRTVVKRVKPAAAAEAPFMQIRFTEQTLYWIVFGIAAIIFTAWLYTLDAKVRDLYDQVDSNMYQASVLLGR